MATLNDEQKQFLICRLAEDVSPAEAGLALKEMFELDEVPKSSQIARYNPDNKVGEELSPELKALFYQHREQFRKDIDALPLANKAVRIRELTDLYRKNKPKSPVVAKQILEQIAREKGGQYEQRIAPADVDTYVAALMLRVHQLVDLHVTDGEARDNVKTGLKELLLEESGQESP